MKDKEIVLSDPSHIPQEAIEEKIINEIVSLVVNSLTSEHSRRAYEQAIRNFIEWYNSEDNPGLSKRIIQQYKKNLQDRELAPSTINLHISAIKRFINEAIDNRLLNLDPYIVMGIEKIKGIKDKGIRTGNWLTLRQAQKLLDSTGKETLKGKRDKSIFAVLLGTGLRREEIVNLTFSHLQQREGRWVFVDIRGKGNKLRTVPVPSWTKYAIDLYTKEAGIGEGYIFRPLRKGNKMNGDKMTAQAIRNLTKEYAKKIGVEDLTPHDLRRTFAKLVYKAGARLDQIQMTLGHSSIETTERYLGVEQELTNAPCDKLELRI